MNRNRRGEIGGAFSYESGAAAIQLLYMVRALPHVRLILNCINGLTLFSPRASQQLYHTISPFSSSLFSYVQHIVVLLCRIVSYIYFIPLCDVFVSMITKHACLIVS